MAKKSPAKQSRTAATKKTTRRSKLPVDVKRQEYDKALGLYEKGLDSLQHGRIAGATRFFQQVIDRYPDERELHERCHRYLEVCRRRTTPVPKPKTAEERVYAATLALNNGQTEDAVEHLQKAAGSQPDSDEVQYLLAVALAGSDAGKAVSHLEKAIAINPDNRVLARHESGFDTLQDDEAYQRVVAPPPDGSGPPA